MNYHYTPGGGNFFLVGGKRYQLTQFHFHRPSEERVRGKAYDMVLVSCVATHVSPTVDARVAEQIRTRMMRMGI